MLSAAAMYMYTPEFYPLCSHFMLNEFNISFSYLIWSLINLNKVNLTAHPVYKQRNGYLLAHYPVGGSSWSEHVTHMCQFLLVKKTPKKT